MQLKPPKAVVVLSGGLDSTVALAHVLDEDYECQLLAFDYGQKHSEELSAAMRVAEYYRLSLSVFSLQGLGGFSGSSLLANGGQLPENRDVDIISNEISSTYVPGRNLIFLSIAASVAESIEAEVVVTGFNFNDSRGIPAPDGRVEFQKAVELAMLLGTKCGVEGNPVEIYSPLLAMSKREVIEYGASLSAS